MLPRKYQNELDWESDIPIKSEAHKRIDQRIYGMGMEDIHNKCNFFNQ